LISVQITLAGAFLGAICGYLPRGPIMAVVCNLTRLAHNARAHSRWQCS